MQSEIFKVKVDMFYGMIDLEDLWQSCLTGKIITTKSLSFLQLPFLREANFLKGMTLLYNFGSIRWPNIQTF